MKTLDVHELGDNDPCKGETEEEMDVISRDVGVESIERLSKKERSGKEYMCNICYLAPEDPVLTHCGHLFCWACIYAWSQSIGGCKFCPTCRSEMGIDEVISVLATDSKEENTKCPPRPMNNRKPVKVIMPGMKINGTRFGNCILQEDEMDVFSCRTVLGLLVFVCIVVAVTLKSYFLGN